MYTKQEMARLREEFWTALGKYMSPIPSADGEKVNWVNYKTGVKDIRFVMQEDGGTATVAMLITHADATVRDLHYEKMVSLRTLFHDAVQENWEWQPLSVNENGSPIAKIVATLSGATIKNTTDWPVLISFFKSHIIAMDKFWTQVKEIFETI